MYSFPVVYVYVNGRILTHMYVIYLRGMRQECFTLGKLHVLRDYLLFLDSCRVFNRDLYNYNNFQTNHTCYKIVVAQVISILFTLHAPYNY